MLPLLVIYIFVVRVSKCPRTRTGASHHDGTVDQSALFGSCCWSIVLVFEQAPEGSWRSPRAESVPGSGADAAGAFGAAIVLAVVWEQDLGGLIAALGVGSIVLGLALQETLGNLMSGIALLFEKPFTIGDWIEVGTSRVRWWKSTGAVSMSGPGNEIFWSFPILCSAARLSINYARPTRCRHCDLSFGFSLDDPPNKVKDVLLGVAEELEDVLDDPPPRALVREVQDDRIRYETFLFIDQPTMIPQIVDGYTSRVWYACQRANIQLPLPAAHEYQIHAR